MNIQDVLRRRRAMKAQAQQRTEEQKRKDKIHAVPTIALVIANVLVLSLDIRVVDAIYKLTNNWMLAIFALFTTGAMFVLWFDVLYQYLLANVWQSRIAIAFSGLSLVSAGFFAFLDYGLSAGFGVTEIVPLEATLLFAGMVVLTIANGIGLFWWYIIDDQVKRKGVVEKQRADSDFDAETLADASKMLNKAGEVLQAKELLEKRYGKDAVEEMLEMLAGIETALGIDLDGDGFVGKSPRPQFANDTKTPRLDEAPKPPANPQKGQ
jgi:hypothetical protein